MAPDGTYVVHGLGGPDGRRQCYGSPCELSFMQDLLPPGTELNDCEVTIVEADVEPPSTRTVHGTIVTEET